MSRNKLTLTLLLLMLTIFVASAQAESLISEEMIQQETVNYSGTVSAEIGVYERSYSEQGTEYYPYTQVLRFEGTNARFKEFLVSRRQEVKAGDVLATFELDIDEVGLAAKRQTLLRMQEAYEAQKFKKQETIFEQEEALSQERDPFAWEILKLSLQRAQISLEQYCIEQEREITRLQQEISELEDQYSQTALIAPFDGIILNINYKQSGQHLYQNEELITLYRTDEMMMRINNSDGRFRYGMDVTIAVGPYKSRTYLAGRVVAADLMLPENQRSGYAYIEVLDSAKINFSRGAVPSVSADTYYVENVLTLPSRAVEIENGKYYVYKLNNGTLGKRYVNVAMKGPDTTWLLQGVEEGETIIID